MTNETYDIWAIIYRKTGNFRVVQFSRVNLSVFLLLRTIKMVSNDISVTSFLWRHGDLYHAAFYQKPSWRVISRSVLHKIRHRALYYTAFYQNRDELFMRSVHKKGHTYVTHSRSWYFMSLHYKWDYMIHVLWYVIYIIHKKVWLCGILIHLHHKTTRGNAKHSTCKN